MLNLYKCPKVTGSGFTNLSNLKELHCDECYNLEKDNLISLLKCALNLKLLNLRFCNYIHKSVLDAAVEVTKNRKNNVKLEIRFHYCPYGIIYGIDRPPLLLLISYED